MLSLYADIVQRYPMVFVEDPFAQDLCRHHAAPGQGNNPHSCFVCSHVNRFLLHHVQVMGDDILATNPEHIQRAVHEKACNALLLKLNQIGSVSETIRACLLAQAAGDHPGIVVGWPH